MRLAAVSITAAALLAGCGANGDRSIPPTAVARIASTVIPRTTFAHWLGIAAGHGPHGPVLDPPRFARCVANTRRALPHVPNGAFAPSDARLVTVCRQSYASIQGQVMQFLLSAAQLRAEGAREGVSVSDAEVNARLAALERGPLHGRRGLDRILRASGMSLADVMFRLRVELLAAKLQQKAIAAAGAPSAREVAAYYAAHRAQFALPERRDLLVVVTRTRTAALAARRQLRTGSSFGLVVKRFSIDVTTRRQGGRLSGVVRGPHGPAFDNPVFGALKSQLVGPVATPLGFYVIRVTAIHRAQKPTPAAAAPAIRRLLAGQRRQRALAALNLRLTRYWRGRTTCARGYTMAGCGNAPTPPKPQPTPGR